MVDGGVDAGGRGDGVAGRVLQRQHGIGPGAEPVIAPVRHRALGERQHQTGLERRPGAAVARHREGIGVRRGAGRYVDLDVVADHGVGAELDQRGHLAVIGERDRVEPGAARARREQVLRLVGARGDEGRIILTVRGDEDRLIGHGRLLFSNREDRRQMNASASAMSAPALSCGVTAKRRRSSPPASSIAVSMP